MNQISNEQLLTTIGTGVLYPKQNNRFLVVFGEDKKYTDLSLQIISVSEIDWALYRERMQVTFEVEDDVHNRALKAMEQIKLEERVEINVRMLDGNETTVSTLRIKNARVTGIKYCALDYRGGSGSHRTNMYLHIPDLAGNLIETIKEDPVAAAVLATIKGARLEMVESHPKTGSNIIRHFITFGFDADEMDYVF